MIGQWISPEDAEINAQVKSYSREFLVQRSKDLETKKIEIAAKQQELQLLKEQRKQQMDRMTAEALRNPDEDGIKQKIEAGPLKMARGLVKSATDLATGGITDPKARLDICASCPFLGDDKRCGKCGCFTPAKARVKKSSCPIGRW